MEIEKKRETSWKIQLREDEGEIQLTSVEISGKVKYVKLAIIKNEQKIEVEMNSNEFFNFLSLISAFKDVVIGETSELEKGNLDIDLTESTGKEDISYSNSKTSNKNYNKDQKEELDPKDWDPW
ncbi:MAG: hypothetical protein EU547_00030 [Promethearchaeota archaeon]|nr:MAG: hypothetical protein EU547_00030 [Candidatus Lokiarchaeota archaeon]